ncbi:MAG: electron transfer flavoprotein subunit alpha/FixB family protein [Nitrososphaerales archaeon]
MKYEHLIVCFEHDDGNPANVSFEMLGEGRRMMDDFNKKYSLNEKVIAIILGHNIRPLCERAIHAGADAVIFADHPELRYPKNIIDTKVICSIVRDRETVVKAVEVSEDYVKPRYMFFGADAIGRHLSSTVLAELESGLASDVNKLIVEDVTITHEHKTKGKPEKYEKILFMYRPDFSGFLWTQILCLDNKNPEIPSEFSPQACSIIPGIFQPVNDESRKGNIVEYEPSFSGKDLRIRIRRREIIRSEVPLEDQKVVVAFGRGIKDGPESNIKLIEQFAKILNAEIAISLPLSKQPYDISQSLKSTYFIPARVVGTSGKKIQPKLYIAIGISGAAQHIVGMKDSEFVLSVNPDPDAPIKDESDVYIQGRMEDVLPTLIDAVNQLKGDK